MEEFHKIIISELAKKRSGGEEEKRRGGEEEINFMSCTSSLKNFMSCGFLFEIGGAA